MCLCHTISHMKYDVSSNCAYPPITDSKRLASASGWLPLILALMYERLNPESKWRAYLDAFPNFDNMELPMFWPL